MRFGIDISTWDSPIDWDLAKTKLDFVFIKAFEYQKDNRFDNHWNGSKGKVPRGAYYFWRQSSDIIDKARTEQFLDVIGRENYDGELPVVIDLEDSRANRTLVFNQMDRLSERIKQVTKRYPIIYTGMSYWKEIGGEGVRQSWADAHPLWISLPNIDSRPNFEQQYNGIMSGVMLPFVPTVKPFRKVDFIQWTYRGKPQDIPGYPLNGKKAVDFNFFLGSESEFTSITNNFNSSQEKPTDNYSLEQKVDILWKYYQSIIKR